MSVKLTQLLHNVHNTAQSDPAVILLSGETGRKGDGVLDAPHFQCLNLEMSLAQWDALECVTRLRASFLQVFL